MRPTDKGSEFINIIPCSELLKDVVHHLPEQHALALLVANDLVELRGAQEFATDGLSARHLEK